MQYSTFFRVFYSSLRYPKDSEIFMFGSVVDKIYLYKWTINNKRKNSNYTEELMHERNNTRNWTFQHGAFLLFVWLGFFSFFLGNRKKLEDLWNWKEYFRICNENAMHFIQEQYLGFSEKSYDCEIAGDKKEKYGPKVWKSCWRNTMFVVSYFYLICLKEPSKNQQGSRKNFMHKIKVYLVILGCGLGLVLLGFFLFL